MKFEYDQKTEETRKPVAYIDSDGDLMFLDRHGEGPDNVLLSSFREDAFNIVIYKSSEVKENQALGTRKFFYPGDSVTITF